jgi:hypothetical protein
MLFSSNPLDEKLLAASFNASLNILEWSGFQLLSRAVV